MILLLAAIIIGLYFLAGKLIFFIAMGILTAAMFCYDKKAAIRGERRLPEKQLWFFSFFGGSFGALITIFLIRHKSSKPRFYLPVILAAGLHVLLIVLI